MKKFTKKIIPGIVMFAIGIFLVGWLVIKLDTTEIIASLLSFSVWGFVWIVFLSFLGIVAANWRAYIILKSQKLDIKFFELLRIWITGNAFNYLMPFIYLGGEGIKAYLLKERFNISWDRAASTLIFDRILEITVSLLMIAISLVVFLIYAGPAGLTKTVFSVIISVVTIGFLILLFYAHVFKNKKVLTPLIKKLSLSKTRAGKFILKSEQEVIDFFVVNRGIFWKGWGVSVIRQLILLTRHVFLLYFLGKGINFAASFVSLGALYLGFTVPIPASLGVQEAFQSIAFSGLGLEARDGLALSFVLRGADILVAGTGIIIFLRYGIGLVASGAIGMLKLRESNNNKSKN